MEQQKLKIRFEGDSHEIDSNTLINMLIHYNNIITLVSQNYDDGNGGRKIGVKVNALEKGSFVIDLSLQASFIKSLFSSENVNYLAGLMTVLGAVFAVYKHYKGRPLKSDEDKGAVVNIVQNIVINNDKNVQSVVNSVVNSYNDCRVREAFSKSMETAIADENVDGIGLESDCIKGIRIPREEFQDLVYNDFDNEDSVHEDMVTDIDNARLVIKTLSFESGVKWSFLYQGFSIKFPVKDDALMEQINRGMQFGKGDSIIVKLRITKKYNEVLGAYENKSYKIVEFYSLEKAGKSEQLYFE